MAIASESNVFSIQLSSLYRTKLLEILAVTLHIHISNAQTARVIKQSMIKITVFECNAVDRCFLYLHLPVT